MIAGVDEVGRGPLVGPVVAAAVILDPTRPIQGLADSKALSDRRRRELATQIHAQARCVSIVELPAAIVDRLNILQATFEAMRQAVAGLSVTPDQVFVDGNRVPPGMTLACTAIVKGDQKKASISAASIVAKVRRDDWCIGYHLQYPDYGFERHKGYPTREHLQVLNRLGPTPEHRRSFKPVAQLSLI